MEAAGNFDTRSLLHVGWVILTHRQASPARAVRLPELRMTVRGSGFQGCSNAATSTIARVMTAKSSSPMTNGGIA